MIYDPCAASKIDCGGGKCSSTIMTSTPPVCRCENNLTLVKLTETKYDCICPSDGYIFTNGSCVKRPDNGKR